MRNVSRYAWTLLFVVGLGFAYFAYDNVVVIPGLDANDPQRGWAWLTSDPEVIDYIQSWFRTFGLWVLAVAVFTLLVSATGYRQGQKWAWFSMAFLPVHIVIHMFLWPWTLPILAVVLALTLAGLLVPFRTFFPDQKGPATEGEPAPRPQNSS